MNPNSQEMMDKCPIDGELYVPDGTGFCSKECKQIGEAFERAEKRKADRIAQQKARHHKNALARERALKKGTQTITIGVIAKARKSNGIKVWAAAKLIKLASRVGKVKVDVTTQEIKD